MLADCTAPRHQSNQKAQNEGSKMKKLKMQSAKTMQENVARIRELFPACVTEARDTDTGEVRLSVDLEQLGRELVQSNGFEGGG